MISTIGSKRSFTLIEVLLAAVILALGTVLVYESFFVSLDAFAYYSQYVNVASWANERIWQEQDSLMLSGRPSGRESRGHFDINGRKFAWVVDFATLDGEQGLYRVDLSVSWAQSGKARKLTRTAYALYHER